MSLSTNLIRYLQTTLPNNRKTEIFSKSSQNIYQDIQDLNKTKRIEVL